MRYVVEWSVSGAIEIDADNYDDARRKIFSGEYDEDLDYDLDSRELNIDDIYPA